LTIYFPTTLREKEDGVVQKSGMKNIGMLFLAALIWGFAFVAQVVGMESVGTFTFNGLRYLIGVAVLLPLCLIILIRKKDIKALKYSLIFGIVAGIIMFAATTLQQYGIELDSGGNSMKAGFITGQNICVDGGMTSQMIYHDDKGWKLEI
jgi:hypothetical protein